jgi:dTDP-4-amino-4,6-dideoxygalactose transaminase
LKIPLVDLRAQYLAHKAEIDRAIQSVIDETAFIGGNEVSDFEHRYARQHGFREFISCANGTDAIYIALRALGIERGDEVITTAHSWISTSETITQAGARPVFVDVDEYFAIDVDQIAAKITPKTKALIVVHLYGQPAEMEPLVQICERHHLTLIEDCAQAHFATYHGRLIGTFGHAATFSFYPGKNLGAYGDAGGMTFRDAAAGERARMYANHGALKKHQHVMEGVNSRLDGLQAAVLNAKLPHVVAWTAARRQVAAWYDEELNGIPELDLPKVRRGCGHVYHLYVVRTDDRSGLQAYLAEGGIQTAVHYPTALPFLPAYAYLGYQPQDFPRAAVNQRRILSLPIYPEMTREMVKYVADRVAAFFAAPRRDRAPIENERVGADK